MTVEKVNTCRIEIIPSNRQHFAFTVAEERVKLIASHPLWWTWFPKKTLSFQGTRRQPIISLKP